MDGRIPELNFHSLEGTRTDDTSITAFLELVHKIKIARKLSVLALCGSFYLYACAALPVFLRKFTARMYMGTSVITAKGPVSSASIKIKGSRIGAIRTVRGNFIFMATTPGKPL